MPRGGAQPGAGRPVGTGRFKEPTYPIRAPKEFCDAWFAGMRWRWKEILAAFGIESEQDEPQDETVPMRKLDKCPNCNASWIGEPIPLESRHNYGGATHFRRSISIYDNVKDCWVATRCPDCNYEHRRDAVEIERVRDLSAKRK